MSEAIQTLRTELNDVRYQITLAEDELRTARRSGYVADGEVWRLKAKIAELEIKRGKLQVAVNDAFQEQRGVR